MASDLVRLLLACVLVAAVVAASPVGGSETPSTGPEDGKVAPHHECIHDVLAESHRGLPHFEAESMIAEQNYNHGAHAASNVATRSVTSGGPIGPIRILLNFDKFGWSDDADRTCMTDTEKVRIGDPASSSVMCSDTVNSDCWFLCTDEARYTDAKGVYLEHELLPAAQDYLQRALSVVRVAGNLVLSSSQCGFNGGVTIPNFSQPTDMVLFVTARPTLGNVIAYAGSCKEDQFGRPVAGHMNFGPNKVDTAPEYFEMNRGVAIHEITHALGFQASKFPSFKDGLNSTTNRGLGNVVITTDGITYLKTPKIVEVANAHFGCSGATIDKVPVEDAGGAGTAGSHWEKRLFMDEFMTGSSSIKPVLSVFTLALLEDSGWYLPNYEEADRLDWGRGKGCDFVSSDCGTWTGFGYECNLNTRGHNQCTYDRKSKGYCQIDDYSPYSLIERYQHLGSEHLGGFSELADFCPVTRPYSNGLCSQQSTSNSNSFYLGEVFHNESRCFESSLASNDLDVVFRQNCHRSFCFSETGPLYVQVHLAWHECVSGQDLPVDNYDGVLKCPDVPFFCADSSNATANGVVWPNPTAVEPLSVAADDIVTITGTGFAADTVFYLGLHLCSEPVLSDSKTSVTCKVAAHPEYTGTETVYLNALNANGRGHFFYGVEFRANSNSLLDRAKDAFNDFTDFSAANWWWIFPAIIFLCLACTFYKVCIKSSANKVAPAPPPQHHAHHGHHRTPHHAPVNGHHRRKK